MSDAPSDVPVSPPSFHERWWRTGLVVALSFIAVGVVWRLQPFGKSLATFDDNWDHIRVDLDCDGAGVHARIRGEIGASAWSFEHLDASLEGETLVLRIYQRLVGLGGSSSLFDVVVPAGSVVPKNVTTVDARGARRPVRTWVIPTCEPPPR